MNRNPNDGELFIRRAQRPDLLELLVHGDPPSKEPGLDLSQCNKEGKEGHEGPSKIFLPLKKKSN